MKSRRDAIAEASKQVVANEFGELVDRNGGVGLNAFTNSDETGYFYSLPSNRLELWAYLESERSKRPVMREFYTGATLDGRATMRTDSRPIGRMLEQLLWRRRLWRIPMGVRWLAGRQIWRRFRPPMRWKFWETYYTPANMAIAIVGDVKASEAMPMLEAYFGRLPKPAPLSTVEPKQFAERQVILRETAQPFYAEGYHRPDVFDKDDAVYEAIADLMSTGRTARLYRSLVRDKNRGGLGGFSGMPGRKYPHLFAFYAVPTPG